MINLSNEQRNFLEKLSEWASSDECKQNVFNRICSAFQELMEKKEKTKENYKLSILKEEFFKEIEKYENAARTSKTNWTIESIRRDIKRCYESGVYSAVLLKFVRDIDAAKEYLLSYEIKSVMPSDSSLDSKIENMQMVKKLDALIAVLDEWIANPDNFYAFSPNKILAIQEKYQKYKNEFNKNRFFCSVCVLSNYINKPEEAKDFLSEIFTKRQETFYSNMEKWAESLDDKDCSRWLCAFLNKGKNLRIRSIVVLNYIDDENKAKEFLLSKYEEKLSWDKKKKEQREIWRKSVFDNYDDNKNSFNSFVPGVTKFSKLYAKCLSANLNSMIEPYSIMSYEDGMEIRKDCMKLGFSEYHLSLRSTNQLFYIYSSTYRKHTTTFTFFSPFVVDIVKIYCSSFLDKDLLEHTMGLVAVCEYDRRGTIKSNTCFLTDEASQLGKEPYFVYNIQKSSDVFYHDVAGYRLVFKALIWHLLKDKTDAIDFSANRDYSQEERCLLFDLIDQYYESMSFDDKYICHFIDTDKYKFPENKHEIQVFNKKSLADRITNLKNCISCQYNSRVFEDRLFQSAKVEYEYGDTNFKKLVVSIGGNICNGKYIDLWFDNTSVDFISSLRTLTFLNWVYVSNETGNIKKITACWLIYVIYKQYKNSFVRDKNFWTLMLAYILIENQSIFDALIGRLKNSIQKIDEDVNVASIVVTLTKDIKQLKKKLTFEQKSFLSLNINKCTLFENYRNRNENAKCFKLNEVETFIKKICELIENNRGTMKDYSKQSILELLIDVPNFVVPNNFTYTSHRSYSYDKYKGDYSGTYAHDEMGYSNSDIDTIFDGDPDAYWNID